MVCAQLTPGPTAAAGLVLPLRGRSTELYARHGFQVTRPVEHRPGTGSGWGEGSEGREGCRRRGLRLPGTWGNAECHQEAHSRSREAATAPTVDSVAPGPHSPAPVLPASCGTGEGGQALAPRAPLASESGSRVKRGCVPRAGCPRPSRPSWPLLSFPGWAAAASPLSLNPPSHPRHGNAQRSCGALSGLSLEPY